LIDVSVLKPLLVKDTYNNYKNILAQIPNMEHELRVILDTIKTYYNKYPDKADISVDELKIHFNNQYPAIKNRQTLLALFDRFEKADVKNIQLLIDSINQLSEIAVASMITEDCIEIVNNYKPDSLQAIQKHLEFYQHLTDTLSTSESKVCKLTLTELLRLDSDEYGIDWELDFLKNNIGSLKPGTLGHIFAYSETGKTSLGVFEAVNFAKKIAAPDCILYLGNEESVTRTKLRAYCAFSKSEKPSVRAYQDKIEASWDKHIGDKLKFIDDVQTMAEVEQYIQDFRPKIVFIDQGTKVYIPGDYSEVKKLQQLYNRYRQLAGQNNTAIITLGQADATCANRRYLKLNNMDMSKVGIPGELDLAIGIGKTDEEGFEQRRYLSICKNKLTGSLDTGEVVFYNTKCTFEN